jgi:hypothetical protein
MSEKNSLRAKAIEEGKFFDDFKTKLSYWEWRVDKNAGFELEESVLKMFMGPTEALYYSNAEISDGSFDDLPWQFKTVEIKARLLEKHFGSAGWGFWNHSMVVEYSMPIWFIYLRSRGSYPFSGFFAQVGNIFQPILLLEKNFLLTLACVFSKVSSKIVGVKVLSLNPTMQELKLEEWHNYKVKWKEDEVLFYIDEKKVAEIPFSFKNQNARLDIWIDNAVFEIRKNDPGRVYRHATQENRKRSLLEVDYVKVY